MGNRNIAAMLVAVNAYRATLRLAPISESQIDSSLFSRLDLRVSKAIALDEAETDAQKRELVRNAQAGSREALEQLIRRHQGWIYFAWADEVLGAAAVSSFLTISPPFITNLTRCISLISFRGSPATAIRSANLPFSIVPKLSCLWMIAALTVVAMRSA